MASVCSSFDTLRIEEQWGDIHDETYRTILRIFLVEGEDLCRQVRFVVTSGEAEEGLRHLHTLRGAAANVGASRLAASAGSLEAAIKMAASPMAEHAVLMGLTDLEMAWLNTRSEIEAGGP